VPKLPLAPMAVFNLVRGLRTSTAKHEPLALAGARSLVEALQRELSRGGDPSALRDARPETIGGAAALVYVATGEVPEEDERLLLAADVANVPIVVLGPDPRTPIPYALATDVVPLRPGEGFPLDDLGRLLAGKSDDGAVALASRLPVLRPGICDALIASAARQNGILAAAIFVPGMDFPVLTLNQLRLVLRLAAAYGQELDGQRVPEILGVVGAGLGFRTIARQAVGVVPIAGWAVQGAVAYTGTRALGEAAVRYFEARASGGGGPETGTPRADRA
jgi:uncharacterized protein (DUF697 family)